MGLLLVRLEPVGRLVGAAVHGLAGLGVLWLAATQVDSLEDLLGCLVLLLVTFGVAGALFTAPVRAWFTVEGRAAAGAVPTRPYVAAVAFTNLLVALFVFVVPAFQKMFKEVGVNLPVFTEVLLSAADFCQSYPWLARPALLLAPVALLRLSPRHERPAFQAAVLLGLFLLASTAGALLLPLVELFQKL